MKTAKDILIELIIKHTPLLVNRSESVEDIQQDLDIFIIDLKHNLESTLHERDELIEMLGKK